VIPAFEGDSWNLPRGLHAATLDEIEKRFVDEAPFADRRRQVFAAFRVWHGVVTSLLPEARFWVDGGFVTHKTWSAPSDVDVTVMVKLEDIRGLVEEQQKRLHPLFTNPGPPRQQPMSGLVDSFLCLRGDVPKTLYWREHWSRVLDEAREEVPGAVKGFLEVKP
jgi:hypothetical protein